MTDKLNNLAERVEASGGPDRELDEAIGRALGWRPVPNPTSAGGLVGCWVKADGTWTELPQWTRYIDAALSLVPEGWGGSFHFSENRQHRTVKLGRSYPTNANTYSEARTDALAIAAAALRARALSQEESNG